MVLPAVHAQKPKKQMYLPNAPVPAKFEVDTRIDNMSYWRRMASLGKVPVQQDIKAPLGVYGTSKLIGKSVMTEDSPDVPVTTVTSTQSENSIFVNPQNVQSLLQSNNSTQRPVGNLYGANSFLSTDAGTTWGGTVNGAGGNNSGDPATAISLDGRYYVGYIHTNGGQGVSYSTDQGTTWTAVLVAPGPPGFNSLLDKNHMWIDNSPTSPYAGNLYDAWTNFGGSNDTEIEISRSTNGAVNWSTPVNISSAVNAGSHNQGVNIQTGPNGEVYVIWIIYDTWPSDENCIAMAKSLDGGVTWQPAVRILSNIRGIRNSGTDKNMRVNSFPTSTVDISDGPNRGNIYITWANTGTPGINTGSDIDVYMIKSTDQGATWSTPLKVNQDASGLGKEHYFPWITSDPENGNLSVIYYDNRNVAANQNEVYTSNSSDGGATWWDMKVSDVSFTPSPIPGLADGYFGDYLANHARGGWVYPTWTDNRSGYAMTYISPFVTGPPPNQPWLVYNDNSLNDAGGNGNGLLDFGESSLMNLSIENQGDTPANAVNVVLSTDNTYITITDNTASFGNIPVGEIVNVNDAFGITVANNIPDAEVVTFTIAATDANDSTYYSNFNIEAHAPGFKTGNITLTELTGNGNNRLDANETATITIATMNSGDYRAYDVTGTLTTSSPYITIDNPTFHWDSINPGPFSMVNPVFNISVSPETPTGHFAEFTYQINSQYQQATKLFKYPVGLILEDWETGNFSNFAWQFGGSATWTTTSEAKYEGNYSAVSGDIGNNATSELKLQYNVATNDSISFYVKVSSESGYDFLKFYIDNVMIGQWSGDVAWHRVVFPVNAGEQTFRWVYSKDGYDAGGLDAAWIDYIVMPPLLQTTSYAGPDGVTCERESYMLNGTANNFVSTAWSTSGDGTFDNATALTCFYTPGANDITSGSAVLTLTVNGPLGELKTDHMDLTISGQATVSPLLNIELCTGSEVPLVVSASDFTSSNWTTSGTGTFSDPTALTTVYQPSADDYTAGTVTLTFEALSASPCGAVTTATVVSFNPLPTATLPADTAICVGGTVAAQINLTGTAPWTITMSNVPEVIETSENPYILTLNPGSTTTYAITSFSDGNACVNTVDGNFTITVNPLPVVSITADSTLCAGQSITLTATSEGDVNYSWNPGNQTTSSITVDTTGIGFNSRTYTVDVTNNVTGCSNVASSTVSFEDCSGFDEITGFDVMIYPNPSKGIFTIKTKAAKAQLFNLEIYDINNKLVYKQDNLLINAETKVQTTKLTDGVYTLYLKNKDKSYSSKLVIKN
jgi:hypothetical protein